MKYAVKKVVYMLVTADVYELPVACFDTVREMARYLGKKENCVSRAIMKGWAVQGTECKPIRVIL